MTVPSAPLLGSTALITGASRGIGAACASALARAGANLVLCSRNPESLAESAESLRNELGTNELGTNALGTNVLSLAFDVRDADAVKQSFSNIPAPFAEIDILINNAGLARSMSPIHEQPVEDFDEMVDTNVKGLLYVTRAIVPGMVERGRGHIVNIGSTSGHDVYPGGSVYCATKHAVGALTRGFKMDLHGTPIRVSTVDPGMVETDFSLVRFRGDRERAARVYADTRPLTAEDVAEAVLWCLSRPPRVNIAEIIMTSVDQSSATLIHRSESADSQADSQADA